jgi:integrase
MEETMAETLTDAAIRRKKPLKSGRLEIPDGACSGLYLSVYESGIKSFVLRYKRPGGGKSVRMTLGRFDPTGHEVDGEPKIGDALSLKAARQLCIQLQRDRKRGKDPASERKLERSLEVQKADSAFGAAALQFLREYTITRADAPERRPRGWRESARLLGWAFPIDERDGEPEIIKGSLVDRWRDRPVAEIDAREIAAVIDESKRSGVPGLKRLNPGLSTNRGRKMHATLHVLFGWLQGENRIIANPVAGLRRPRPPASRDRVLNCRADVNQGDELRWFWSACDKVGEPFGTVFRMLLLTGARRDEIGQMRWDELNDDRTVLRLSGARTKNSRAFELPLPPLATKLINGIEPVSDQFVFTIAGRSAVGGFAKAKARLDAAMLELARKERGPDAEIAPFRLHDLRRSAATGMSEIGIMPFVVESVLNHVSGFKSGVAGTYNLAQYSREKADALIRWSEYIDRITSGTGGQVIPYGRKRRAPR